MEEPRTHYQLSFTSGQALAVFLVVLGAIAGAYFFGLMTGLAGREPGSAAAAVSPSAAAEVTPEDAFPTPVLGVDARFPRRPSAAVRPTAGYAAARPTAGIQLFADRAESEAPPVTRLPTPEASARAAAGSASGFWVQVVSLSSEREARARTARLTARGYPAVVVPGQGAGQRTVYRVRVGPFERREDAARAAIRLKSEEKTETWIVPSGR